MPSCANRASISHIAQTPEARNNNSGFAVFVSFGGKAGWEKFIRCMTSSNNYQCKTIIKDIPPSNP